jgi:NDP-sugar pyrophosphorylase family protein
MNPTVVLLAAGMSTRYGRLKQLEPLGPEGEALLDYAVFDALRAGISRVLLVIREELEEIFRAHVEDRWPWELEVVYHHQNIRDLPGIEPSLLSSLHRTGLVEGREKPWGTAHALLTARPHLPGPFILLNADDFYGEAAYRQGTDFLLAQGASTGGETPGPDPVPTFGLVTYTLSETLSHHGGVSRAVCSLDVQGRLEEVVEVLEIQEGEYKIGGRTVPGAGVDLEGTEQVSTNFWLLTPAIFPILEEGLSEFMRSLADPWTAQPEFLIPTVINQALRDGAIRVQGIPTEGRFLGITHPEDRDWVEKGLEEMTHEGLYPRPLWDQP